MNLSIWVPWTVVAVLGVISIVLLMGKGSFLIAGYNIMNMENKRRINEKRLCRVWGGGSCVLSVILGIATSYSFEMPAAIDWIIPWGLFGTIIIMIILANTICRRKSSAADE